MVAPPPGPLWLPDSYRPWAVQEKALDLDALNKSVVADAIPTTPSLNPGMWLFATGNQADSFVQWGAAPAARDRQLREFWPTEPFLASAVGIIAARNTAMNWKITGTQSLTDTATELLQNANFGHGWEEFLGSLAVDILTQDRGAFVEIIREGNAAEAPCVGIQSLDAGRCHLTGVPETPVIYVDAHGGQHLMQWYQVCQLLEIPSPITFANRGAFYRLQSCALTRVLRAAQIIKSIGVYNEEKISGRFTRAVHLISGIDSGRVEAALRRADVLNDAQGLIRYSQPVILGSIAPDARVDAKTIEMASMPAGFDEDVSLRWYVTVMAMAFLTDYQEFAPLPGNRIGSSAQSEMLDMKSRGKGQGLFMSLIARLLNLHGVLPEGVQFEWNETNIEQEKTTAEVQQVRAQSRAARITSGEISPAIARQLAVEAGDLSEEQAAALEAEDKANEVKAQAMLDRLGPAAGQSPQDAAANAPGPVPDGSTQSTDRTDTNATGDGVSDSQNRPGVRSMTVVTPEYATRSIGTVPFGTLLNSRLHRTYAMISDDATAMGYFPDLRDRLAVGQAIGPALNTFEDELRKAGVWDIPIAPEDADRMVEFGMKQLIEGERDAGEDSRLAFEGDVAVSIERGLAEVRRNLRRRLGELQGGTRALDPDDADLGALPALVEVHDIEHDDEGHIVRVRTSYEGAPR